MQWLWELDPQEPSPALNQCHLLGLLLARFRGRFRKHMLNACNVFPNMVHGKLSALAMSLRQVREQLDDMQLHWNDYVHDVDKCHTLLDALMTRFGVLCDEHTEHDDVESLDANGAISVAALRHFLSVFLVLYRHVWLWTQSDACSEDAQQAGQPASSIHKHHVEASLDVFEQHSMIVSLPPAARLLYQQDFQGMYHGLSQVVFFHFPDYDSPQQLPLEQLRAGRSYHTLAPLLEVEPLPVIMDDQVPQGRCYVLLSGGHVFLWEGITRIFHKRELLTNV